jgi:beta-ureidopropionase / N-carbamoyl-L-amino-acid hydrolase
LKATASADVRVDLNLAATLFEQLDRATRRGRGIVRDSYGAGEQAAHEGVWLRKEAEGADLLITSGELFTDAAMHAPSKVAGETRFVLDLRSVSESVMDEVAMEARHAAEQIGRRYRVSFDLGAATDSPPAVMDIRLRSKLLTLLEQPLEMPSGAGHDAAVFTQVGIPSAMILVRNDHGSHNPDETMELEDFAVGTRALIGLLREFPF